MVSQNHTVANNGTDNDDVDGYASAINREMRAIFFRELDIYARPRRRTGKFAACNEIRRVIRGKLVGRVGLNWIMMCRTRSCLFASTEQIAIIHSQIH